MSKPTQSRPNGGSPNGKVALVTGGSRGIGRAIVEGLAEDGFRVFFSSLNPASVGSARKAFAERFGDQVAGEAVDVRDQAAVEAWVARVEAAAGRIDCLVNNAGLGHFGAIDQLSGDAFRQVIETNLNGSFYCIRAVAPGMKRRGDGWIFNIASLAAKNPFAGGSAYNASKFGLLGMSEAAMLDLRPHGIRVATILPGSVDTEFRVAGEADTSWMLTSEDVARAVRDLLAYPSNALPSLIELRPARPPRK